MALAGSLLFFSLLGVGRNRESGKQFKYVAGAGNQHLRETFSSCASAVQQSEARELWGHVLGGVTQHLVASSTLPMPGTSVNVGYNAF